MTMVTNDTDEVDADVALKRVSRDLLVSYIPVIVFLFLLTVVGLSGNITTILYFGRKKKKSSTEMFMTILAVVDFVVCILIFLYITQLFVNISVYTDKYVCKVSYFIYHWGILLSISILCAIAVDRFKKICWPFTKQFTAITSIRISFVLFIISGLISSRDFWTYDSFAVNVTISDVTVEGRMCMNTRDSSLRTLVRASHAIDVTIVTIILLVLVVSYAGIVRSLYKHKKAMEAKLFGANLNLRKQSQDVPRSPGANTRPTLQLNAPSLTPSIPSPISRSSFEITQSISKSERSTTLMMLTVSVGLLVCFVPYFIATLIKLLGTEVEYELTAWYRFAISFVLANSVINPVIYCLFNPKYRGYLTKRFLRCIREEKYTIDSSQNTTEKTGQINVIPNITPLTLTENKIY